ncbi:MAG TPA: sulfatase-like hydrolase/transferase [Vicinamibacterales bacterium]|nr:sulfatase-like hydrolase/transferase [Vicinamibacterales bacterium]
MAVAFAALWLARRPSRPGPFIVISIDTLRADRLPVYGYARGRTPAIDGFARDAVVFDRAYAHAPQTLPSHASMFTGHLPFEHKVRDNLGFTLAPDAVTLAERFHDAGYTTAGFVSAYVLRRETGIGQGFDLYDATFPAVASDRSPAQVQRAGPDTLAAAEKWLSTLETNRFFLFFHIYEPHKPYRAPERFADLAPYDGEVAFADEITGRLLDVVKKRGWYDEATIVVLSDHGEGLGDHIEEEHGLFLYDEVVHVPWLIKLPANASRGRRVTDPVQHIDLFPTLAALAGLAAVPDQRGRDLSVVLFNRGSLAPQGIYAEALYPRYHFGWSELLSLTDERYRYIKAPREELYDLERDPGERTNLLAERTQAASALRSALAALVAGRDIDKPGAVSAEDRQRLAALGYVGTQSAAAENAADEARADPKDKAPLLRTYRQAVEMLGSGRTQEGAALLAQILKDDPNMTDVWSQYAGALVRLNRLPDAFAAYARVIRLQPDEPNGALGAASVLLAMQRLDEARAHAELAVKASPSLAHQALALIAVAGNREAEALREADLAAAADPGLPMPALVRGTLAYNAQRYDEALRYLMEARQGYAGRSAQARDLHFMIGDSLARLERYAEAEPFLREEVRLYPEHVRARASLAMLYQSMNRTADAERVLTDLVRDVPSPDAYATAARVWRMFGRPDRAASVDAQGRGGGGR